MPFILLILGFFLLIKGADSFVGGASSIAKKFNVPSMIIGLTIVAMGTSAPEAAVSITSALAGQNDMCVANVVGSNLFNILMVLGVSSIITKLPVEINTIKKDAPFLVLISIVLLGFSYDLSISRLEGILFLMFFTYFLINTIKASRKPNLVSDSNNSETAIAIEVESSTQISMPKTLLVSTIGILGIVFGGDLVVKSATTIATSLGMSANLVGLTIVAVGTSLPEFVTSIVAIKKGESEIAIGNVIGSNLFNMLLVLGLSTSINPIAISPLAFIDIIFMTFITGLLYLFMKKNNSLIKHHGFIFVILYVSYMSYTIIR